tara:strand:- start:1012 stop:2151 length:1140 start_codon:yes stop_codon:yes gene_type:complete
MSNLKVVHIIPNLKMGGAERLCLDIIQALKDEGVSVLLVLLEDKIEHDVDLDGIEVFHTSARSIINPFKKHSSEYIKFKEKVLNFKPDIVHTHLFEAEMLWKSTMFNIPTIFHIHDNIKVFSPFEKGISKKNSWFKFLEKKYYLTLLKKQTTKFLCISKDTERYIKSKFKGDCTILLHNAIKVKKFINNNKSDLNVISLITIGSLVENKGHLFLIDVVNELIKLTDRKVQLSILGDGYKKEEILNKIKIKKLGSAIRLLGKVKNPEVDLSLSDFYIHGAFEESFGLVLIEAMAAGLPVFTTDGRGNRDLIIQGENGMIYKKRDAVKIAEDILSVANNPKKYDCMSKFCVEYSKKFDIQEYVIKLIKFYKNEISKNNFSN